MKPLLITFAQIGLVILSMGLQSCASARVNVAPGNSLKNFKRAYIEPLAEDEFDIYGALFYELNDMGMEVVGSPFQEPMSTDLLVNYTYAPSWDMTRYLQSFQFRFSNALTGSVVAAQSYKSKGLWRGVSSGRLESAFNDLRAKNGYPPTRQFD